MADQISISDRLMFIRHEIALNISGAITDDVDSFIDFSKDREAMELISKAEKLMERPIKQIA